ncbi:WD40-repeat-containing domain protein [Phlyctochytrium arcticum]|nr:WD40-repeat-containing domain protein [Phlyctochytrium arcticum]
MRARTRAQSRPGQTENVNEEVEDNGRFAGVSARLRSSFVYKADEAPSPGVKTDATTNASQSTATIVTAKKPVVKKPAVKAVSAAKGKGKASKAAPLVEEGRDEGEDYDDDEDDAEEGGRSRSKKGKGKAKLEDDPSVIFPAPSRTDPFYNEEQHPYTFPWHRSQPLRHLSPVSRLLHRLSTDVPTARSQLPILPLPFYLNRLRNLRVFRTANYFDRRVSALEWHPHPNHRTVLAMASKTGDVAWWDFVQNGRHEGYVPDVPSAGEDLISDRDQTAIPFLYGRGAGGTITAMKFHPTEPNMIYTTSGDGTVKLQDFEGRRGQVFLDTMDRMKWHTALDISRDSQLLMVGSNTGHCVMTDLDGVPVWQGRLHKAKCHDVEFHPAGERVVVTAGNDRVVKIWDLRMMRESQQEGDMQVPLQTLDHEGVVNSATFSPLAPYSLLTTSQDSVCRLYSDPLNTPRVTAILPHPHRPFQHLTAIRASWSPVMPDLFVVGRYPDTASDRRTIDMYQYTPGMEGGGGVRCVTRVEDVRVSGIQVLAKFDYTGEYLATCSGFTTYMWSIPENSDSDHEDDDDAGGGGGGGGAGSTLKRKPSGKKDNFGRGNAKSKGKGAKASKKTVS